MASSGLSGSDLTAVFQYLKGSCRKDEEQLFAQVGNDRTRGGKDLN